MNLRCSRRPLLDFAVLTIGVAITLLVTLNNWHSGDFDVFEYQQYAQSFWWGQPRFQALPHEYPPLSLLSFSVTLLAGHGDPRPIFGICIGLFFLLGYLAFLRFSDRYHARWYAVYLLFGAQGILLARYDLLPALLTLAALWATQRRRFSWAYVLLALGILFKLYPIVLLPIVLIHQAGTLYLDKQPDERPSPRVVLREIGGPLARALVPGLGLLGAGIALPLLRTRDALAALTYMSARPVQVESFPATLLWLSTLLSHRTPHVINTFGADNWTTRGPLDPLLVALSPVALAVGCLIVYWQLARRRISMEQAFLACVCIVLVTSKVFSTQYLIWVLPLVAEVEGGTLVWMLICLLTFLDYPLIYPFNQPGYTLLWEHGFMLVVALRNALLLYVILRIIRILPIVKPHPTSVAEPPVAPHAPDRSLV